jgi:hypothetical protein
VSANMRLVLGHVYWPLRKKLAVKNPLIAKIAGATRYRIDCANTGCERG